MIFNGGMSSVEDLLLEEFAEIIKEPSLNGLVALILFKVEEVEPMNVDDDKSIGVESPMTSIAIFYYTFGLSLKLQLAPSLNITILLTMTFPLIGLYNLFALDLLQSLVKIHFSDI